MTIDEAIKLINTMILAMCLSDSGIAIGEVEEVKTALNMAIMALEYMHEDWAEYEEYCKRKESEKEWKN